MIFWVAKEGNKEDMKRCHNPAEKGGDGNVYLYIESYCTGFAPNMLNNVLTFSTCKPGIRLSAEEGDWVIGITSSDGTNSNANRRIVFAFQVQEKITMAEYWKDPRFKAKRPRWKDGTTEQEQGDNAYQSLPDGTFRQLMCRHFTHELDPKHEKMKVTDLSGKYTLISHDAFSYYGPPAYQKECPAHVPILPSWAPIPGRNYLKNFAPDIKDKLIAFVSSLPRGNFDTTTTWSPPTRHVTLIKKEEREGRGQSKRVRKARDNVDKTKN